jgi:hypothetical protein
MVKKGEAAGDKIDALWFIIKSKFSVAVVEAIDFTTRWGEELGHLGGKLVQNESDFVHWADTHKYQ